ncbi:MAG: hypothetical protein AAGK37_15455 [Pseudomonadota bacterium]
MPIILLIAITVMAYLWWRWRFTSLTRDCRWREDRRNGAWRSAFCGAEIGKGPPRVCLRTKG